MHPEITVIVHKFFEGHVLHLVFDMPQEPSAPAFDMKLAGIRDERFCVLIVPEGIHKTQFGFPGHFFRIHDHGITGFVIIYDKSAKAFIQRKYGRLFFIHYFSSYLFSNGIL